MVTAYHLKLLAFGLMIIDHVGRLFFPQAHFMVAIGRSSFPLFAYLAATGEKYSANIKAYLLRLVVLGILTQPIYAHFFHLLFDGTASLNILFGLAMGVATLRLAKMLGNPLQQLAVILFFSGIAALANVEGGLTTIPTIVLMSTFRNTLGWWLSYVLLEVAGVWILSYSPISLFSLCAPLILMAYNGKQGPKTRLFYGVYPLHFLILIGIYRLL